MVVTIIWPAVLTYTFLAGERATAQVSACHRDTGGRSSQLNCTGTWRTEGGETGSGGLYGLDREDEGTSVEVRIGPLGPHGHGFAGSMHVYVASAICFACFAGVAVGQQRAGRRAGRLLAAPAPDGDLLLVTGKGARTPDGRRHASAAPIPSPHVTRARTFHWEVRGPAGQPMFHVEKTLGKKRATEMVIRDLSGAPRHIIRSVGSGSGRHYMLLHPDGTPLGRIDPSPGVRRGAYEIKDAQGAVWARAVLRMPEWVLRMEPGAPAPFPYLALAFTIGRLRKPR